jgi:hypothetical protein
MVMPPQILLALMEKTTRISQANSAKGKDLIAAEQAYNVWISMQH